MFGSKYKKAQSKGVCALIAAAGSGSRMGCTDTSKIMLPLSGRPVIAHTLIAFEACESIDDIVVVARGSDLMLISDVAKEFHISKLRSVVAGGDSRSESVDKGLSALPERTGYVCIADGARPLVSTALIARTVEAAKKTGGAAAAIPVRDSLKRCIGSRITASVDRSGLYQVQTPQVFDVIKYRAARMLAKGADYTDDTAYFEKAGFPVEAVEGEITNIKITYEEDIALAEAIIERRCSLC